MWVLKNDESVRAFKAIEGDTTPYNFALDKRLLLDPQAYKELHPAASPPVLTVLPAPITRLGEGLEVPLRGGSRTRSRLWRAAPQ